MLHINFRGNRSNGSREEIFEGFLTYMDGHLVTSIMSLNFNSLVPKSLHTKFGSK